MGVAQPCVAAGTLFRDIHLCIGLGYAQHEKSLKPVLPTGIGYAHEKMNNTKKLCNSLMFCAVVCPEL